MRSNHKRERQTKERQGMKKLNNQGLEMCISKYNSATDIYVNFENGFEVHTTYQHFKDGNITNYFEPTVCGIGIIGNEIITANGKKTREYNSWHAMLCRCTREDYKQEKPTYQDSTCVDEWCYLSNFTQWIHNQENWNVLKDTNNWGVDKDILVKGNKLYSPETCCLVPMNVNSLFTKHDNARGEYPIGVYYNKANNNFASRCQNPYGKRICHYGFKTPEDAFEQYKKDKEMIIKRVAQDEFSKGTITKQCYDAMMKYEVEITD